MKQYYRKMQQEILPDSEKQAQIWRKIEENAPAEKTSFRRYIPRRACWIAACVMLLLFCLPQTGLAKNIIGFLRMYFYEKADVADDITSNVYEDRDEHMKMQIQQMLSDGACVYLDICYEALDEAGKTWLSEQDFESDCECIRFMNLGDDFSSSTDWGERLVEHKEMATDTARYFSFYLRDGSGNFSHKDAVRTLAYPMYRRQGLGELKLDCNLAQVAYRLEGEGSPSKFYTPKYLIVSKLSFGIFGDNEGVYATEKDEYGAERINWCKEFEEEYHAKLDSDTDDLPISFIRKDNTRLEISPFGISKYSPAVDVPGYDLKIAAGYFNEKGEEDWKKNTTIDPYALSGIELDGVYYGLILEN